LRWMLLTLMMAVALYAAWMHDTNRALPFAKLPPVRRTEIARVLPDPTATPVSKVRVPQGVPIRPSLQKQVNALIADVERVRGLRFERRIVPRFLTPADFRVYYSHMLDREWPQAQRQAQEDTLIMFGLASPSFNINRVLEDDPSNSILGFYELDSKRMFIIGRPNDLDPANKVTLSHELTHALQDQHFRIQSMYERARDNEDAELALRALVEGDATLSEMLYMGDTKIDESRAQAVARQDGTTFTSVSTGPAVLTLKTLFPYLQGASWVGQLYRKGGWGAVNRAYGDPPESTEQVLHPGKYLRRDHPTSIELPRMDGALGPMWQVIAENTLGELQVLAMFLPQGSDVARTAASGWDGDRYRIYQYGEGKVLVWESVWDTTKDAREAEQALRQQQIALNDDVFGRDPVTRNGVFSLDGADSDVRVARQGKCLYLVVSSGTTSRTADKVMRTLLD